MHFLAYNYRHREMFGRVGWFWQINEEHFHELSSNRTSLLPNTNLRGQTAHEDF